MLTNTKFLYFLLGVFVLVGAGFAPAHSAHAAVIYSNSPADGIPTGTWVAGGGMLSADRTGAHTASVSGSVNWIDWTLYTWYGSGDMVILCKVNGSTVDSATLSRSLLNQTFSGSLPPYGSHSYIYARLQITGLPWSGSGCNYSAGDTVELDEWNGSGHSFVAPYDSSSLPIVAYGSGTPGGPTPNGDGIDATHVLRVNSPTAYATTTSPVTLNFDALVANDFASTTDGYAVTIYNEATGQNTLFRMGLLPTYTVGIPFSVSSTTLDNATSSALTLHVQLLMGTASYLAGSGPYPTFVSPEYGQGTVPFAVGGSYSSRNNPPPPAPYAGPQYSSSDCAINFLGTFSLPECIGYLVQPASSTMQDFSNITLRNRFPFAYMYGISDMRNSLFAASSTASTTMAVTVAGFGTITFISSAMIASVPFAGTIKFILSALMWILTLELLYVTLLRSHNQNTGV